MLGHTNEMCCFRFLKKWCFDGDLKRECGFAGLQYVQRIMYTIQNGTSTFPSAQSNMSWSGKLARYMEVVHSHTGKPSKTTTAQKDRMTRPRVFMLSGLSGGGWFLAFAGFDATLKFASSDAVSIPCAMMRVYYPDNGGLKRAHGSRSWLSNKNLPGNSLSPTRIHCPRRNIWPNEVTTTAWYYFHF